MFETFWWRSRREPARFNLSVGRIVAHANRYTNHFRNRRSLRYRWLQGDWLRDSNGMVQMDAAVAAAVAAMRVIALQPTLATIVPAMAVPMAPAEQ